MYFSQQWEHLIFVFRPGKYIFGVAGVINNDFFNIIAIYVVKRMRAPESDEKKNKNDNDTKHNNYNFLFHERYLLFQFGFKRLTAEELLLTTLLQRLFW